MAGLPSVSGAVVSPAFVLLLALRGQAVVAGKGVGLRSSAVGQGLGREHRIPPVPREWLWKRPESLTSNYMTRNTSLPCFCTAVRWLWPWARCLPCPKTHAGPALVLVSPAPLYLPGADQLLRQRAQNGHV